MLRPLENMPILTAHDLAKFIRVRLAQHPRVSGVASEPRDKDSSVMWINTKDRREFSIVIADADTLEASPNRHDYKEIDLAIIDAIRAGHGTREEIIKALGDKVKTAWRGELREPRAIVQTRLQRLSRKRIIRWKTRAKCWVLHMTHLSDLPPTR